VEEVVNRLMEHPQTQRIVGVATHYFDNFGVIIDRAVESAVSRDRQRQAQHQAFMADLRRQAATQKPAPVSPRDLLGFTADEALTEAKIRKRLRAYAKIHHPDIGGSSGIMQRYTQAADILLRQIGAKR